MLKFNKNKIMGEKLFANWLEILTYKPSQVKDKGISFHQSIGSPKLHGAFSLAALVRFF